MKKFFQLHPKQLAIVFVAGWVLTFLILQYGPDQYLACSRDRHWCEPTNQTLGDSLLWATVMVPTIMVVAVLLSRRVQRAYRFIAKLFGRAPGDGQEK